MGHAEEQTNVSEIVARQVSAGRGDTAAFIAQDATLTYDELRRQVNRAGHLLRELGVRREQRVLLVLDDTTVFPIAFLGAIRIGAVPVPVSHLDKDDNFRHFVDDSYAEVIVTDAGVLDRLRGALGDRPVRWLVRGRDGAGVTELDAAMAAQPDELDAARTHRDDMAFWLYSSGSTGKPKGVVHLQHDIGVTCEQYAGGVLGLGPDDIHFSTTKLFHAYGLGNGLTFPLWFGGTSVLMSGPPKPPAILDTLRRHRPSVFFSVRRCSGCSCVIPTPTGRWTPSASACPPPSHCPRRRSPAGASASASTSSTASAPPRCCTSTAPTAPATCGRHHRHAGPRLRAQARRRRGRGRGGPGHRRAVRAR